MGGSIVLRHGALIGGVDAVVAVSSPGQWYYRGTRPMRLVHFAVESRTGRLVARTRLKTRIGNGRWDPVPMPPADAAARIAPVPLLIVHGDKDRYFPVEHAQRNAPVGALDRIGGWIRGAVALDGQDDTPTGPVAARPNVA